MHHRLQQLLQLLIIGCLVISSFAAPVARSDAVEPLIKRDIDVYRAIGGGIDRARKMADDAASKFATIKSTTPPLTDSLIKELTTNLSDLSEYISGVKLAVDDYKDHLPKTAGNMQNALDDANKALHYVKGKTADEIGNAIGANEIGDVLASVELGLGSAQGNFANERPS